MKRKVMVLISLVLILGTFSTAFAASFADVTADYSWADEAISAMSEKGIINGYPDGTFKPATGITRIQAMLLISRILGFVDGVYSPYIDFISEENAEVISELKLDYEEELAFLIYKGVFTAEEIASSANGINQPLSRYEVAEYLTRAMGKYSLVKGSYSTDTGYSDEALIPESYRSFVCYVKDAGLMQGTSATTFAASDNVTRAQMAVMLYRVINALKLTVFEAEFESYSAFDKLIQVKIGETEGSYDTAEAVMYVNGKEAEASEISEGENIILVFSDGVLLRVEKIVDKAVPPVEKEPEVVKTIHAKINDIILSTDNYLNVVDSSDGETKRFYIADECKIEVDGRTTTLSAMRNKDHVILGLTRDDEILEIEIVDTITTFKGGVIADVDTSDGVVIEIETKNGDIERYITTDAVAVKRNSENVTLAEVLTGDTVVSCELTYNRISALQVKSIVSSTSGSISEIVISKEPSIVISGSKGDKRYEISNSIKVTVDGDAADIYTMRLGMNASVTLDSNVVTKIEVNSVADVGQLTGQVKIVNTSYGFVNVALSDGTEKQVFVNSSTKLYDDGSGRTRTLANLKEGESLVIIGKIVNGAFQATTIIVVSE